MPRIPESEKKGASPGMVRRIREYAPTQPIDVHIPLSPPPGPLPIGSQSAAEGGASKDKIPSSRTREIKAPNTRQAPTKGGSLKQMLKG